MSSGSYHPPPVRLVEIPKDTGGTRPLGIPTISDRVAQTVAKMVLEPLVEPRFHPDSYGYRPGRSALDAVGMARQRCWETDWVIDLDIRSFFDFIPHDLVERAVAYHTDLAWVRLYVGRWLRAPVEHPDGSHEERTKGTPQGGVASPLLANLFLHYAFDLWMHRNYPGIRFERYADDAIVHCGSEEEARSVLEAIRSRFAECGLELHPEKTKIVYCKEDDRPGQHEHIKFDFLGYTFQPRRAKLGAFLYQLPAGDQQQGRHSDPANHSRMAKGIHQEQPAPGGSGSLYQPGGAGWMNYRAILSLEVHSGAPPLQRGSCPMGATEVQAVQASGARIHALAGVHRAADPNLFVLWKLGVRPEAGV